MPTGTINSNQEPLPKKKNFKPIANKRKQNNDKIADWSKLVKVDYAELFTTGPGNPQKSFLIMLFGITTIALNSLRRWQIR